MQGGGQSEGRNLAAGLRVARTEEAMVLATDFVLQTNLFDDFANGQVEAEPLGTGSEVAK